MKTLKALKIASILISTIIIIPCVVIFGIFYGLFEIEYSVSDLVKNYEKRTKEINALKNYINSISPKDKRIEIEFASKRCLRYFLVSGSGVNEEFRNIKIESDQLDSSLLILSWSRNIFDTLNIMLDKANCISFKSQRGMPFNSIGFKRSGMGIYYYRLFDQPIAEELKDDYNNGCKNIFYNDTVVFNWYGGTIGPDCFENYLK